MLPDTNPANLHQGFTEYNDIFGYKDYADGLSNLLIGLGGSVSVVVDGEWGSGKSVFCKQFQAHLKEKQFPVLFLNAFQNDYETDAFMLLVSKLSDLIEPEIEVEEEAKENFKKSAAKVGKALLPVGSKILLRCATMGILRGDEFDGLDGLKSIVQRSSEDFGDVLEREIASGITDIRDREETIDNFKEKLREYVAIEFQKTNKPVVFVIDELDRCRPNFALSIIEALKHFFDTPNLVFLVYANLNQLQAMVKAEYGSEIDGQAYLRKFFSIIAPLPSDDEKGRRNEKYIKHMCNKFTLCEERIRGQYEEILLSLCNENWSLRDINSIITYISLYLMASNNSKVNVSIIVAALAICKHLRPDVYKRLKNNEMSYVEFHSEVFGN